MSDNIQHITYLTSRRWVCEKPETLGFDFIILDSANRPPCRICSSLLLAHNERTFRDEALLALSTTDSDYASLPERKETSNAHDLKWLLIATATWVAIVFILHNLGIV